MKKLLLLAICATSLKVYALPTYEPFTEFATTIASNPTNLVVRTTNGVSIGTNANASISNCIDLATGGYSAPSGEAWTSLNFSGTGTQPLRGLDIAVISNANIFTYSALSSLLPATFPGMPASGQAITNCVENPAQPLLWGTTNFVASNYVGDSAVLNFASDITRPTNGTKTLFVSYLISVAQLGQLGTGNDGRFLDFVAATNLVEGTNAGSFFTNWSSMFNTFDTTSNKYCGHAVLESNASFAYFGAADSSTGKNMTTSPFLIPMNNTPIFVVGAYVFSASGHDTNLVWVNPVTSGFGGPTPPSTPVSVNVLASNMTDIGGLVLEDRVGNGASGGVGTNYIANLLVGSTWSYVTGGPEFTTQPQANTSVTIGRNATLNCAATAAAQTVSYQWQKITGGTTNNLTDGSGTAGGSATVSGSLTANLSLSGISSGDLGTYQCLATASGTSYSLASSQDVVISDPTLNSEPQNVTVNYGGQATFSATFTTSKPTLSYQWYNGPTPLTNGVQGDGSTVSGASGTVSGGTDILTLTVSNVSYLENGNQYSVIATNNVNNGEQSSNALLTVIDPYIITQPANQPIPSGNNATFTVLANGSTNLNYQWYYNGTALSDGPSANPGSVATNVGSLTASLTIEDATTPDDGNYYVVVTGSASSQSVTSSVVTLTAETTVVTLQSPKSLTERVGDHLAFVVEATGGGLNYQWALNGTNILGATSNSLVVTNIQTTNQGTYTVTVGNVISTNTASATLTIINSIYLNLAQTNLVVVRVGDGVQSLSGTTGNTIYLDQYTSNGTYVSTVQIPDENTGQAYGTGSGAGVFGSPALLVAGAGADAQYEGFVTTSGNQQYLDLAGYCQEYPFTGGNINVPSAANWRGLATVNAFGLYSLAYTNLGLYNGGPELIHSMVTLDDNVFYTAGEAGSAGGLKYANKATGASYANGNGIPTIGGSLAGTRVVQIVSNSVGNNLVWSDQAASAGAGIYSITGLPTATTSSNLVLNEGGQPNDFAISPDGMTIYIADSQAFGGTNSQSGGVQRWDTNSISGGYMFSYTLPVESTATLGAQGLTVNFSANVAWGTNVFGAVLYATSATATTNTLARIVDNGLSSTPTVIATAGANQVLRGVRFGPAAVPVSIVTQPAGATAFIGNSYTFNVTVNGSAPLYYQWQFGGTNIAGATGSSYTLTNLAVTNAGNYTVVISNMVPSSVTSSQAVLNVFSASPAFTLSSYVETVGDHLSFAPAVTGSAPLNYSWSFNGTNFSTNPTVTLTDIQTSNSGTYTLVVSNAFGVTTNSGTLTVTTGLQPLSSNNLVVVRIGDGAQPLSTATGNTVYLDQYTTGGSYVNTIQIPDEGGQAYGTGSANSASLPFGSPALLVAGSQTNGSDADYEGFLTLSSDGYTLDFVGYVQGYPFAGTDVTVDGTNTGLNWRGVGEVGAIGAFSLAYTNSGLESLGLAKVHAAVTSDQTNYWVSGEAGSSAIKYFNLATGSAYAGGNGLPGVGGSASGTRVVQVISGNVVFSDQFGASGPGIYEFAGLPTGVATPTLLIAETNSAVDFAFSPDGNTVYIADNGAFGGTGVQMGGVQRWDTNTVSGGYSWSYTLGTGRGSTVGARAVTVDFSANATWGSGVTGANVYVTTAQAAGNGLLKITDNGPTVSATRLVTAGPTNTLAGVRFGPSIQPLVITSQPQNQAVLEGSTGYALFSVGVSGPGPYFYQWGLEVTNIHSTNFFALSGATNATLATTITSPVSGITVVVTNTYGQSVTSAGASAYLVPILNFFTNGAGWSANAEGVAGIPVWNYSGSSNAVELTTGVGNEGDSTFYNDPVYVGGFLATWTYQVVSPAGTVADGTVFVLQNDARGPNALGASGGDLGYGGGSPITNSVGLVFDIYSGSTNGVGVGLDTNGVLGVNINPTPVVINGGDPINVTLQYLNGIAAVTLFDTVNSNSFTTNLSINIPATVGSNTAYVGFTGADGGTASTQVVSNFVYIPLINLSVANAGSHNIVLSWPTGVGGYVLQQNGSLTTTNWTMSTNAVTVVGGLNQVTVPASTNHLFYQLVLP